jgi:hypothetical protein
MESTPLARFVGSQGIRRLGIRAGFADELGPPACDSRLGGLPLHDDIVEFLPTYRLPNDDHNRRSGRPERACGSERLTDQAFGPIAFHRVADAARGRDA